MISNETYLWKPKTFMIQSKSMNVKIIEAPTAEALKVQTKFGFSLLNFLIIKEQLQINGGIL